MSTKPHPSDRPLIRAQAWAKNDPRTHDSRIRKSHTLLDLLPAAVAAHERRQEILVADDRWPIQHWYNDEDFCRAYNTAIYWKQLSEQYAAAMEWLWNYREIGCEVSPETMKAMRTMRARATREAGE
jgi:hypothetical protein